MHIRNHSHRGGGHNDDDDDTHLENKDLDVIYGDMAVDRCVSHYDVIRKNPDGVHDGDGDEARQKVHGDRGDGGGDDAAFLLVFFSNTKIKAVLLLST